MPLANFAPRTPPPRALVGSDGLAGNFAGPFLIFFTTSIVCEMFLERFSSVIFVPVGKPRACEKLVWVNPPSVAFQCLSLIDPRPSLGSSSPIVSCGRVAKTATFLLYDGRSSVLAPDAPVPEPPPAQAASVAAAIANERAASRVDMKPPRECRLCSLG